MKIVFAGTPEFAAPALAALCEAGHDVALVLTQPDRPSGRGLKTAPSAVKQAALARRLQVEQPATLKDPRIAGVLAEAAPDVMVVAAYGLLLPQAILDLPRRGCVNIHASLLPRWRGAAPIQRALLAGDACTGISIMQMDAGLDTGPVLLKEAIAIAPQDTAGTLHDRLAALGARLIVQAFEREYVAVPQNEAEATYAAKVGRDEARIEWNEHAATIERKVRAFNPVPGAWTTLRGATLKVWGAGIGRTGSGTDQPGNVTDTSGGVITVAAGSGTTLTLLEVQRAGGRRLASAVFLSGMPLTRGERLGK
jgi:methionyl-tRNA formyltransferase